MSIPLGQIIKLATDRDALANKFKEFLPGFLAVVDEQIAEKAGAVPGQAVAITRFKANVTGGTTVMARVCPVDEFGEIGEEIATIDVNQAIKELPTEKIKALLPI